MKSSKFLNYAIGIFVAIQTANSLPAQVVVPPPPEPTTGSNLPHPSFPDPNQVTARLTAAITPIEKNGPVRGDLFFTQIRNSVRFVGRIVGLTPNRRYQLILQQPSPTRASSVPGTAGAADAQDGAAGETLDMAVSDANGALDLETVYNKMEPAKNPNGLAGSTIIVKRAPPLDTPEERMPVAAGTIIAIPLEIPKPSVTPNSVPAPATDNITPAR